MRVNFARHVQLEEDARRPELDSGGDVDVQDSHEARVASGMGTFRFTV